MSQADSARGIGRRGFLKRLGGLLAASAVIPAAASEADAGGAPMGTSCEPRFDELMLPGKLGNRGINLLTDPRLSPAIKKALMNVPPALRGIFPPTITMASEYQECLDFIYYLDKMWLRESSRDQATKSSGESLEITTNKVIEGTDGNKIELFIDRPLESKNRLPCIIHIHGGGMSFSSARNPLTRRWRRSLSSLGMIVIGVEFRSETLHPGHHPFPNGLNDCASAVKWAHSNRDYLGVSKIIVSGESGGGNLALATALKANLENWVNAIDGVYALAPMIVGVYDRAPSHPELISWTENLGLQGNLAMVRAMTMVYDPEFQHEKNPLTWPLYAQDKHLEGLPPHFILNYELDLIRDDGVVYARKLLKNGVSAISRIVNGAHHVPEIAMPDAVPELTQDTLSSILTFARGVKDS